MSVTKPSKSEDVMKKLEANAKPLIAFFTGITPHIITVCGKAYSLYKTLPEDQLQFLMGAIICFFGGVYPALFAAIEAAKHGGLATVGTALSALAEEATIIIEASKKDDDADDDKDGKKDVDQVDAKRLLIRKANLVATKMNPEKVNDAIDSIYKVWLAVMAVLAIQFARTVAFAESISNFVRKPTQRYVTPAIQKVVPDDYHKWVPVICGWITKAIAVSLAWYMTTIVVAFTSAMTGGLMMSRALMKIATKKGWTLGGMMPADDKDTMVDEFSSYALAFLGFTFQWEMGFDITFPFSLLLFPVELAEQFIRWSVTQV